MVVISHTRPEGKQRNQKVSSSVSGIESRRSTAFIFYPARGHVFGLCKSRLGLKRKRRYGTRLRAWLRMQGRALAALRQALRFHSKLSSTSFRRTQPKQDRQSPTGGFGAAFLAPEIRFGYTQIGGIHDPISFSSSYVLELRGIVLGCV